MARDFDGSDDKLLESAAPLSDEPITFSVWVISDVDTGNAAVIGISSTNGDQWILQRIAGVIRAQKSINNTTHAWAQSGSITTGVYQHYAGVFRANNDRSVFLDGTKADNTGTVADPTVDTFVVGAKTDADGTGFELFWNGQIAEAAVWNASLTDAEIIALSNGYSPLLIRPANLVRYIPILGRNSPELELISANNMTITGTTTTAHPPMIYPTQPISGFAAAAAPPAGVHAGLLVDGIRLKSKLIGLVG